MHKSSPFEEKYINEKLWGFISQWANKNVCSAVQKWLCVACSEIPMLQNLAVGLVLLCVWHWGRTEIWTCFSKPAVYDSAGLKYGENHYSRTMGHLLISVSVSQPHRCKSQFNPKRNKLKWECWTITSMNDVFSCVALHTWSWSVPVDVLTYESTFTESVILS